LQSHRSVADLVELQQGKQAALVAGDEDGDVWPLNRPSRGSSAGEIRTQWLRIVPEMFLRLGSNPSSDHSARMKNIPASLSWWWPACRMLDPVGVKEICNRSHDPPAVRAVEQQNTRIPR
jgi:hypothetical protein